MPKINRAEYCRTAGGVVAIVDGRCPHTACPDRCAFQPAEDPDAGAMTAEVLCPIGWAPMSDGDCGQGEGCLACCPYSFAAK